MVFFHVKLKVLMNNFLIFLSFMRTVKVIKQLFRRGVNLNYVLIIFSSQHCLETRFKLSKIQTRLFTCLLSIASFFQIAFSKDGKSHVSSHEQYLSKHRFLDICRCAFKKIFRKGFEKSAKKFILARSKKSMTYA